MSIATLIRRMGELGASHEMIALAVEEIEAGQTSLEARRAADRERKRAQREREKSANVTGHSGDCPVTVTDIPQQPPALNKEKAPRPPTEIKSTPHVCVTPARGWHRLPEDWTPRNLPLPVQAKVDQWPPGALGDELAAFRRWAANAEDKNGKGRKLDWDQAWRNWIARRHDEQYSRTHRNGRSEPTSKIQATLDILSRGDQRPGDDRRAAGVPHLGRALQS